MPADLSFSLKQARRLALAAQGFQGRRSPVVVQPLHVNRLIERLGVVQIDSVNALVRSHYLPLVFPGWATMPPICSTRPPGARGGDAPCSNIGGTRLRCCRCHCIR